MTDRIIARIGLAGCATASILSGLAGQPLPEMGQTGRFAQVPDQTNELFNVFIIATGLSAVEALVCSGLAFDSISNVLHWSLPMTFSPPMIVAPDLELRQCNERWIQRLDFGLANTCRQCRQMTTLHDWGATLTSRVGSRNIGRHRRNPMRL